MPNYRVGIDIGSTTVKIVVINEHNQILFSDYRRHSSKAREITSEMLKDAGDVLRGRPFTAAITGSAGLSVADIIGGGPARVVAGNTSCLDDPTPGD